MALSEEITCEDAASQAAMAGKWLCVFVNYTLRNSHLEMSLISAYLTSVFESKKLFKLPISVLCREMVECFLTTEKILTLEPDWLHTFAWFSTSKIKLFLFFPVWYFASSAGCPVTVTVNIVGRFQVQGSLPKTKITGNITVFYIFFLMCFLQCVIKVKWLLTLLLNHFVKPMFELEICNYEQQ